MDALDKVQALIESQEIGDTTLSAWEGDFLHDIVDRYDDAADLTENQCSKIDEIYSEKLR